MAKVRSAPPDGAKGLVRAASRTLWSAWLTSAPIVALATAAVHVAPHARGIGFQPALRFGVVAPACLAVTAGASFAYARWGREGGLGRPKAALAGALLALGVVSLAAAAALGPPGLVGAALPAVVVTAAAIALLVPRHAARPRRSRLATGGLALAAGLELAALAGAWATSDEVPRGPGAMAFDVPRALFDVEHRFVDLPGGARVHYVDEGRGETLLFLHGNPSWSFQWRDLIRGLRDTHRCVALDYPGFGLSNAPPGFGYTPREESLVLEAFVEALGLRDVTLVMQDWGGPIGLGLAGRRPELVRRVVLGSTWAWPTTTAEPRGKFSALVGGPVGEFAQLNFNGFAALGIDNGVVRELSPETFDAYLRPFRPLARRGIAAFYPGQINAATDYFREVEAGLAKLGDKEALIFWALRDAGFPDDDRRRFERAFPRHRTIELPEADHFFFEDAADRMVREIAAFVPRQIAAP
jgi:haloalkane dehalogenase